ncbi:UDP-N-acetylmuramate--L-alanine ligase [uncultured Helicobacter sp.]|uniref:UDP-N-acetylmuramate--L-alanine ligase n=1 Tax=uncultured Helicobacter sp. TaxID=175537 RepID=UPI002607230F|nr:UDP-N-acetylmuramate--L-alanine ligase [uncultured Helicobacter sp.]
MKIHFIGIGGIGISGLAKYLRAQGIEISGSDIAEGSATKYLRAQGVSINIPHNAAAITNQDLVIHSAIIKPDNVEVQEAIKKGIKVLSRKEAIASILKEKRVFSVCGAHGKSTTSAILSSIFPHFGAIIGADSKEFGSNVREAKSESIIFEADESDKSFLNSNPYYAIIPNAEPEHMESYNHDLNEFYGAYRQFIHTAKKRIFNLSDPFLQSLKTIQAITLNPQSDITNIRFEIHNDEPQTSFEFKDYGIFKVWGFGEHMAQNASLAILCAIDELGIDALKEIRTNLAHFKGIKKRFDIIAKGTTTIIDDYAHHPTEILATLKSVAIYNQLKPHQKVIAIWQPHKYSRVLDNLQAFVDCFANLCDELVILPVWKAGESHVDIDFASLFMRYNPIFATHLKREGDCITLFDGKDSIKTLQNAIIIGLGAGDITYQLRGEK